MINKALYIHLTSQSELSSMLAVYGGAAAIFDQQIPSDKDDEWGKAQYPRIVFAIDTNGDPERGISAVLGFDIICENGKQLPEEIEPILKKYVDGYFFTDGDITMQASWSASNYFTEAKEKVSGVTVLFSLLSFEKQESKEPDAIKVLNRYTKESYSDSLIIAYDDNKESAWKPTEENPAMYWRLKSISPCSYINDTYACTLQTVTASLHVFADGSVMEMAIPREISEDLLIKSRLFFLDKGPLMIDEVGIDAGNDLQRQGQLTLIATFGALRPEKKETKLEHVKFAGAI